MTTLSLSNRGPSFNTTCVPRICKLLETGNRKMCLYAFTLENVGNRWMAVKCCLKNYMNTGLDTENEEMKLVACLTQWCVVLNPVNCCCDYHDTTQFFFMQVNHNNFNHLFPYGFRVSEIQKSRRNTLFCQPQIQRNISAYPHIVVAYIPYSEAFGD